MLEHALFVEMLQRAEEDIRAEMERVVEEWEKMQSRSQNDDDSVNDRNSEEDAGQDDDDDDDDEEEEEEEGEESDDDNDSEEELEDDRPTLSIGAVCARGHHRSVAFVEELGRKGWPKEWEVRTRHRDIGKERGSRNKRGNRGGKIKGADLINGADY